MMFKDLKVLLRKNFFLETVKIILFPIFVTFLSNQPVISFSQNDNSDEIKFLILERRRKSHFKLLFALKKPLLKKCHRNLRICDKRYAI